MDSPWAKPFTIPARLLYSVNDFYHAMVRPGAGIARRMFTCVAFRLYDVDPSHKEREHLLADLEANNVELAFRNAELERFTYTVSHDL